MLSGVGYGGWWGRVKVGGISIRYESSLVRTLVLRILLIYQLFEFVFFLNSALHVLIIDCTNIVLSQLEYKGLLHIKWQAIMTDEN